MIIELTSYFHRLRDEVTAQNDKMKICISCRHYSMISQHSSLEVCLEHENKKDILHYVNESLKSDDLKNESTQNFKNDWQMLVKHVIDKALGIF